MGETSICQVYNEVIAANGLVRAVPVETFVHVGTPEEYNAYINGFPQSVTAKVIGAQRRESFRVTMPSNASSAEGG